MSTETDYLLLRGALKIADRGADGTPGALEDVGEFSMFEISVTTEYADNFQTRTAISTQDLHVAKKITANAEMKVKAATLKNIAHAMYGEETEDSGAPLANVAFPNGIADGEEHLVPGRPIGLSNVVIHDSAGEPATLDEGDDYTVDLDYGAVKFLNVTGFTQPFKISCNTSAAKGVKFMTKRSQEKFLVLQGVNIADNDTPVVVEIPRGALEPADKLQLKTEEVAEFTFKVVMLSDPTLAPSGPLGQYGRYREL